MEDNQEEVAQEQEAVPEPAADAEPEAQAEAEPEPDAEEPEQQEAEPAAPVEPEPVPVQQEPEEKEQPQAVAADPVAAYNGDVPPTIQDACDNLYSDNPSYNWMCTTLIDSKKGADGLAMESVGTGGLNELKDKLKDCKGDIRFFCLRVNTYDAEGSSRAKFIYGRFMGSGVKFMQKAKLTPNLGAIADKFPVKHLSRDADEEMKDWDPETLGKEFLRIGGAHKPSKYDFGPNAVYNCP